MISDTLSNASAEIKSCLAKNPEIYAQFAKQIAATLALMNETRKLLDAPPADVFVQ